jgi:hypothetical protein
LVIHDIEVGDDVMFFCFRVGGLRMRFFDSWFLNKRVNLLALFSLSSDFSSSQIIFYIFFFISRTRFATSSWKEDRFIATWFGTVIFDVSTLDSSNRFALSIDSHTFTDDTDEDVDGRTQVWLPLLVKFE